MPDSIIQVERQTTFAVGIHHAVPMELYLSGCTPGPGCSASDLKRIIPSLKGRCMRWAHARWSGNPNRIHDESSDAMALGTAAHTYVLDGRGVFEARYTRKPKGMNFATTAGKAWRAEQEAAGVEVLSSDDYDSIIAMSQAINDHPGASKLLSLGHPEVTCIARDPDTGLYLKARPDWLRPGLAINLKTALSAEEEAFSRQSWNLGYHVSAAVTVDVMRLLGQDVTYAYVVVEKDAPHCVAVRTMSAGWLEVGRELYREALARYRDCIRDGAWPAYGDGASDMELPPWTAPQVQRLMGELSQRRNEPFPTSKEAA